MGYLDKQVFNGLINTCTLLWVGGGASCLWMFLLYPFRKKGRCYYYSFIILKVLFVNLFTDVFLILYYAEEEWFLVYYNCVNFLAVYLSVAFVVFIPGKGRWTDHFIIIFISELYANVVNGMTWIIVNFIGKGSIRTDISGAISRYNIYYCAIGTMIGVVTTWLCYPYLKRFKIKYRPVWLMAGGISILLGPTSYLMQGYWSEYVMIYSVGALCLVLGISFILYLIYQKASNKQLQKINQVLKLQQNLMEDHSCAVDEQIQITEALRKEISAQAELLKELMGQCEAILVMERYIASLLIWQEQLNQIVYWNDTIVDSIINRKLNQCKEEGIEVMVDVQAEVFDQGNRANLSSIIYLMLDCMIDICRSRDTKERQFLIKCEQDSQQISIICRILPPVKKTNPHFFVLKKMLRRMEGDLYVRKVDQKVNIVVNISKLNR